ncbi:MAG: DNA repair protein RecO [Chloroflexota bacterium]
MAAPHLYRTEAIVLKRIDIGEADKVLTLYTPHLGKIRAVARGVRRPTSRLAGHVELFNHSAMMLAKGRNLDIVTQSQTIDSFMKLRDDLWRTTHAYYVAELLDQLTEEDLENYPVYELLLATLKRLDEGRNPETTVRFFEMRVLGYLGYQPELHNCVQCRRPLGPTANFFSAASGGVLCLDCGRPEPTAKPLTLAAFKMLRLLQSGDYTLAARVKVGESLRRELESLLRGSVQFILERELKSAAFLNSLRANGTGDNGANLSPIRGSGSSS